MFIYLFFELSAPASAQQGQHSSEPWGSYCIYTVPPSCSPSSKPASWSSCSKAKSSRIVLRSHPIGPAIGAKTILQSQKNTNSYCQYKQSGGAGGEGLLRQRGASGAIATGTSWVQGGQRSPPRLDPIVGKRFRNKEGFPNNQIRTMCHGRRGLAVQQIARPSSKR